MAQQVGVTLKENVPRLVSAALADAAGIPDAQRYPVPTLPGYVVVNLTWDAWVELPIAETGWTAAALMTPYRGTAQVAELRVFPTEADPPGGRDLGQWSGNLLGGAARCPRGGITARLLRRVPLGVFSRATDDFVREYHAKIGPDRMARFGLAFPSQEQTRRRVADIEVARVASAYDQAVRRKSRRALEEIRETFSEYTVVQLRSLVAEARARGFLTPTQQGKPGGRLTAKGRRVLAPQPTTQKGRA